MHYNSGSLIFVSIATALLWFQSCQAVTLTSEQCEQTHRNGKPCSKHILFIGDGEDTERIKCYWKFSSFFRNSEKAVVVYKEKELFLVDAILFSESKAKYRKNKVQDWNSDFNISGNELKLPYYGITVKKVDGQCNVFKNLVAQGPAGIVHDNLLIYSSTDQQKKTIYKIHLSEEELITFKANVCPGIDDVVTVALSAKAAAPTDKGQSSGTAGTGKVAEKSKNGK